MAIIPPPVLNLTSPLKDGERADAHVAWRSPGVCHNCQFAEIYVSSKITYAQHHAVGVPPVWHGVAWLWRGGAARSSLACLESILYANLTGGRPGLSDGESFHLLSPPASLSTIEMTMEQSSLARVYSFPHWFVSSLRPRSPFPFEIIVIARTNDLINHPLALRHRASGFKSSSLIVSMVQPKYIMGFNVVEELHTWRRCSLVRIAWCISYTVHG